MTGEKWNIVTESTPWSLNHLLTTRMMGRRRAGVVHLRIFRVERAGLLHAGHITGAPTHPWRANIFDYSCNGSVQDDDDDDDVNYRDNPLTNSSETSQLSQSG